jgi:uncharacterized protein YcgI (DUF1989 family)
MQTATTVFDKTMPPKTGLTVELKTGQRLRVVELEGKQLVDMCVFNRANAHEKLSTSWSRTRRRPRPGEGWTSADNLTVDDVLLSTLCRPMLTIVAETADPKGIHDTHIRMCNAYLAEIHGLGPYRGCFEIVSDVIAPYGIAPEDVPDPFNLFLNLSYSCEERRWMSREPVTKPGDYIDFRAEMELLVAFSNCPQIGIGRTARPCTPVQIQVFDA